MFRRVFPVLAVVLLAAADTSVVPVLSSGWIYPLLSYTSVLTFGLLLGRTRGALCGIVAGLVIDTTVGLPFGLMTVLYGLGGYAAGFAGRKMRRNILNTLIVPLICLALTELGMIAYSAIAGADFYAAQLGRAGIRTLINVALVQVEYILFHLICQPQTGRYEMR